MLRPLDVLIRLLAALVLGRARGPGSIAGLARALKLPRHFPITLVLLSVLIAMGHPRSSAINVGPRLQSGRGAFNRSVSHCGAGHARYGPYVIFCSRRGHGGGSE